LTERSKIQGNKMFDPKGAVVVSQELSEEFKVMISGDCCPHGVGEELILAGKAVDIMHDIAPLTAAADVAILQFETPLTETETPIIKSGPPLKVHPRCIELVAAGGFDTVTLANNHTGDHGDDALLETLQRIDAAGIRRVGAGADLDSAAAPLFIEKNGYKLCVINAAEHEFGSAGANKPGSAPLDPFFLIDSIRKSSAKSDAVIVIIHGGNEYNPVPSPRMVSTYRAFADAGASAVINIHTHCPQGIEIHNGVPIIYSLGNFYFPWAERPPAWYLGYSVTLGLSRQGATTLQVHPHTFAPDDKQVRLLSEDGLAKFSAYLNKISEPLADSALLQKYFEAWAGTRGASNSEMLLRLEGWQEKAKSPEGLAGLMPVRNLLTCEAHHELLSTFWRLVEEQRLEEAQAFMTELEKLADVSGFASEMS
jgi:Bacterial capsule synthesis protein PGA_cap